MCFNVIRIFHGYSLRDDVCGPEVIRVETTPAIERNEKGDDVERRRCPFRRKTDVKNWR